MAHGQEQCSGDIPVNAVNHNFLHWSADYVGRDPIPCWDMVQAVYRNELKIDLPRAGGGLFEAVAGAQEFDIVIFRLHGLDDHAGIVIAPGLMLHTTESMESRVERYDRGIYATRDRRFGRYVGPRIIDPDLPLHVNLVAHPFLTERGRIELVVPPGTRLSEMVVLAFPAATDEQRNRMVVRIDGHEIDCAFWHLIKPRVGTIVRIDPVPGKFGLLQILGIVIAVAAVATGQFYGAALAGAITGAGTAAAVGTTGAAIASAVITATISAAGALLINSLTPQPSSGSGQDLFSIDGLRNSARNDQPFPVVFGKRRQSPCYGGLPYMEIRGDDVFLHALFIEGIGDYVVTEKKIADTLITDFQDFEIQTSRPSAVVALTLYDHQVIPTESMGARLEYNFEAAPVPVIRISARDAKELEVIFGFPAGLSYTNSDGKLRTFSVNIKIRARLVGTVPWTTIIDPLIISAKQTVAIFRSYRWTPAVRGQYEVEVTRTTVDEPGSQFQSKVDWTALYAHRPEMPVTSKYPLTLTAVRIRATRQLNGTLDNYNSVVSLVAPDYDIATLSWVSRETSNPASISRYILQGASCAKPWLNSQIDLVSLQDWHAYCITKNLQCHMLNVADTLPNVLSSVAASGRALTHFDGVQWSWIIDKPKTVISGHISANNSSGFTKSRPRLEIPDAFMAVFADETAGYNRAERLVPWPGFIGTPSLVEPMEFPAITSPSKVWIETRRRQHEINARRMSYSATQDIESIGLERGSMVRLNHPRLKAGQSSSRVISVVGNIVYLETSVTMIAGTNYAARFRRFATGDDDQGTSILRTVLTIAGEKTAITLTGSGLLPEEGDLVLFGISTLESVEAIVKQITRAQGLSAQILLVPHAPEIEALTDAEVPPAWDGRVGDIAPVPSLAPSVPVITSIQSSTEVQGGGALVFVAPGVGGEIVASYEVDHRLQGAGSYTTVTVLAGAGPAAFGGYVDDNILEIRARALGITGLQSAYTEVEVFTFGTDGFLPPRNVIGKYIFDFIGGTFALKIRGSWTAGTAGDSYEMEYSTQAGGAAHTVVTLANATSADSAFIPDDTPFRVRVRAVREGLVSDWSPWSNAVNVTIMLADIDTISVVDADTMEAVQ